MALADPDLLCAAQAAGASKAVRDEFADRFYGFLCYCAGRGARVYKLDRDDVDEVVNLAVAMVFDRRLARFDPKRGGTHLAYLAGMVQNAAKQHARFVHRGADELQDWNDPVVEQLQLPTRLDEVADIIADALEDIEESVELALYVALPAERLLIDRHFYNGESFDEIGAALGVSRTTVSRRLQQFYCRAASVLAA